MREHGIQRVEVDGVDVIHVGSNDLLTAMGKPGTFGSAEHIAALHDSLMPKLD